MKRATSKILNFVFLGLLTFAATLFYSSNVFADAPLEIQGVKFQNAWEFMKEHLQQSQISRFHSDFGTELKDEYHAMCGQVNCNLRSNVCMTRVDEDKKKKYEEQMQNSWMSNFISMDLLFKQYACVSKLEVSTYESQKWTVFKSKNVVADKGRKCYEASGIGKVKNYCMEIIDGQAIVISQSLNKNNSARDACEVIPVRWYNNRECTACSMLSFIYAVADKITILSYTKLGFSFSVVVVVGLMVWIAIKTLSFVSSMTKQDAAKYITEIIKQSYKFALAYFALIYFQDVFSFIILPLLGAGISFGDKFIAVVDTTYRFESEIATYLDQNNITALKAMGDRLPADYIRNIENKYFNVHTYSLLENFAYNVNLNYALLQSIGGSLWCIGLDFMALQHASGAGFSEKLFEIIPLGWACAVYGAAFGIFGFLLSIAFIFYLLDAIVQLGIVGAMLPFLIASWPFKITSKYTATGFKMLLNSIFTFMMMGIIVKVNMELIGVAVELNSYGSNGEASGLQGLANALDSINIAELKERVNVLSIGFLLFMFANMIGFLILGKNGALVNRFAGGGMKPIAPAIGGMAASAATGVAKKVAAPTVNAVGEWAEDKMTKGVKAIGGVAGKAVGTVTKGTAKAVWAVGTLKPVRKAAKNAFLKTETGQKVQQKLNDVGNKIKNSKVGRGAQRFANMFKDTPTEDDKKIKDENLRKSQDILGAKKEEVATIGNEDPSNNTAIIGDENKQNDVTTEETPKEGEKPTKENLNELE